ncbi:MAG: riboflavin synthase [Ferrovibrio sp.]|uniref:riboflavin synthase n=1 Tax=Ferrovibrio sp. TaxID=1917215 RepID=UPI00391ABBD0
MFTGIVTDIGTVTAREARGDTRFRIRTAYDTASIAIGASIACSGVCLTVVQKGGDWFTVDVSAETLSRTGLGDWREGSRINLERSLRVGDELGGHIVSGHVDGVGEVTAVRAEGDSMRIEIKAPDALAAFIAEKGSITVDGVSLTVNSVEGASFGVNLIPHTQQVTTLGKLKAGDRVNLEIDTLARYVARLQQWNKPA